MDEQTFDGMTKRMARETTRRHVLSAAAKPAAALAVFLGLGAGAPTEVAADDHGDDCRPRCFRRCRNNGGSRRQCRRRCCGDDGGSDG